MFLSGSQSSTVGGDLLVRWTRSLNSCSRSLRPGGVARIRRFTIEEILESPTQEANRGRRLHRRSQDMQTRGRSAEYPSLNQHRQSLSCMS